MVAPTSEAGHLNEQQPYDYSDNPYLYDTKGPKKEKNYGTMEDDGDQDVGIGTEAEWEGDSYRVTHKGEKFALRPSDMQ